MRICTDKWKQWLSLALALVLLVSNVPFGALAADGEETPSLSLTLTPEDYLTVSNDDAEQLACAPGMVAYGDGKFAVSYLADETNSVETESSTTIVCRLGLFDLSDPESGTFFDIATAGQTIGDVTIGSKAPYEPNLLKLSDSKLLVLFNIRDTSGNYVYYSATFDTATNTVTSYQPLTLDGKSWIPENIAASYNALAENDISTAGPSGSMVFTSEIIQHGGYYYGYCGGICSGFSGILVRSTDGINWTSVMAPEAASEMAGVIECGFQFLGDYVYFCMRDISSGVYHCSYHFSTGEQMAKTAKLSNLTTSKPTAFIQDGQLYVIVNKATGDDSTVGRRNTALFYRVNPQTCQLSLVRQVFCADGCAYHTVEEYNGTNYWCFHTDARRINPYTQGRSNLAFLEIPELFSVETGEDGVLNLDAYSHMYAHGCITGSSNTWQADAVNMHYQIPLADFADYDTVTVTANGENKTYLAFFSDFMTKAGTIAYAEGWTEQLIMEPGTTQVLPIPEDAQYLYILNNNAAGANLLPESVVFSKAEEIVWEQGTIANATGQNRDDTTRLRTAGYLRMSDYDAVGVGAGYTLVRFVYDENYNHINSTDWLGDGIGFSVKDLREQYPEGVYFRVALRSVNNTVLTVEDLPSSGVTFYAVGEEAPIPETLKYADVMQVGSWQEGAMWRGQLFLLGASGTGAVYNVSTGAELGSFTLSDTDVIKPHANSVCFSNTYYAEDDAYPLLYVNVYNNYSNASDRMEGTCCVYRITQSGTDFTGELVQVIRIGFTEDLTLWKSLENNGDVRPYGNFVVDPDSGALYAYTMRDKEPATRFFRFDLPEVTDGVYSDTYGCNLVTLMPEDIADQFDLEYFRYLQGVTYCDGKLVSSEGITAAAYALRIIDLENKCVESTYVLSASGLKSEPEVVCTDQDYNVVYYAAADGMLRKLYLEHVHTHTHESTVTPPTCMEAGYTTHTCTACGASFVDSHVDAAGHSYSGDTCTLCGAANPLSSAWPAVNTDLTHIICYGQSFSVGADAPIYADPAVDGVYVLGSITSSSGTALSPIPATGNQHPIISAGNVLAQLLDETGIDTDLVLGSYGAGGRTIAQLMSAERQSQIKEEEGYTYDINSSGRYAVFQSSVGAIASYAESSSQSVSCPAIVYLQGETDQNTDTQLGYPDNPIRAGYGAGGDKEKYKLYMTRLKEDMQREVMEAYGQTQKPLFLIYQVSGTYTRTQYSSINMAQLEFAQENEDVILIQTPYFAPHYTVSHHLSVNGYRWLGEYIGNSLYTALVEHEKSWPLLPSAFTAESGNVLRIAVSGAENGLSIDTYTVENATNSKNRYGFYLQVNGTNVVPQSVEIDGSEIVLTLPNEINLTATDSVYVYYAGKNANGTGNIRDNCTKVGFYDYLDDSGDTGTGNNQGISHSALDKNGESIIGQKYPMYNWLVSFCYEIEIPDAVQKQAASYHWEMQETGLVSVSAEQNDLTLLQGSIESGILKNVQYSMEQTVALLHNRPWAIEWSAAGNGTSFGGGMLLAAPEGSSSKVGSLYMPADSRGFLAWNISSEGRNYGIQLGKNGIDTRQEHIYRIENRIAADRTNTVYLIVDGVEIGAMNTAYSTSNGSLIDDTTNWANGTDIYLGYMGMPTSFLLNNMKLSYLKIWEDTHTHSYESVVTAPTCVDGGYTTHTCTACGASFVDSHVDAAGHSYTAAVTGPEGLTKGYTVYTCDICGESKQVPWLDASYYAGKTIACIGDSITAGVGVTKDENDYVTLLAQQLGMDYIRLGASGTTLCTDGSRTCNIGQLTEAKLQGADVVTIAMGINDFCAAGEGYYELGDINSTDTSTVYGAARMWCEKIVQLRETESLRDTQFYFVTPVIASWNNSVTSARNWDQSKTNIHGYTLRDLCNAIAEVAALYDVPIIDLNLISGMYYVSAEDNNTAEFGGDGVHPGTNGHAMMAKAIADALCQNELRDDHDHSYGSWITTVYPSCQTGEQSRVCTVCTAAERRELAATGVHSYESTVTAPTCVDGGYTTHTCTLCGDSHVDSYVDAAGHSYTAAVTGPEGVTKGYTVYTCDICGESKQVPWLDASYYEGKTIACIGSSTTVGVGASAIGETDYVTLLAQQLGMEKINLGVSGTTLCTGGHRTCNIGQLTEAKLQGADVVTIMMGVNDFDQAKEGYYTLGDIDSADTSTIYGAVKMWCERIAELRRTESLADTQFYFVTPQITSWNNSVGYSRNWDQSKTNIHGYTLRDLCNAIMEVAALYDVPVIDLNLISGMYYVSAEDNNIDEFGGDGLHVGDRGHEMLAAAHAHALCQNELRDDHAHSYGSWITTVYPACQTGEQSRVCAVCTAVERRELAATSVHRYESVVTPPTCTDGGYTTHTCTTCGDSYTDSETAALGHSYSGTSCTLCGAPRDSGKTYHWRMSETGLVSVTQNDAAQNNAALVSGSVRDGVLTNAQFSLEYPITLCHDRPWVIELRSTGDWKGMLFGSALESPSDGLTYLFRDTATKLFAFGEYDGSWNNYGMVLDCDMTVSHVFRMENRIGADGSNTVYLVIDGQEIGAMTRHYISNRDQNQDVSWANGKDIVFFNMGTTSHPISEMRLEDLRVWEDGHTHTYESVITAPTCTEAGYTTHTCTACGASFVDSHVDAAGHSYGEWTEVKAPTCDAEGQDQRTCAGCQNVQHRDTRISGDAGKIQVSGPVDTADFAGKTLLIIGDSITYGVGVSDPGTQVYGAIAAEQLGMTVINKGVSGSGYCTGGVGPMSTNQTLTAENVQNADVITIMLGINDWNTAAKDGFWYGRPGYYEETYTCYELGEFGSTDTDTLYGAVRAWCEEILRIKAMAGYEDKQFVFITPVITSWNRSMLGSGRDWDQSKTNVHGYTLRQYCTAIMEVATYYGIPVFDANMYSGMYYRSAEDNNVAETGGDGIHFNEAGHALLAEALTEFLLEGYSYETRAVADCGHSYQAAVTAPTCTAGGFTTHYCPDCHYSYVSDYVDAPGHSYESTVTPPTCVDGGYTTHTCTLCGDSYVSDEAAALGHAETVIPAVAPGCTTSGLTEGKSCSRCGEILAAQQTVSAKGHTDETIPAIAPTCTATGLTAGTKCGTCGEITDAQEVVPAKGHTEVTDAAVAATCKTTGLTEGKHCSVCGAVIVAQTVTDKLPHKEVPIPAVAPTCTTTGLTEGKKCESCGEVTKAQVTVPVAAHKEVTDGAVAPTCTATGLTEGKHCETCGTTLVSQSVVPALGHTKVTIPAVAPGCTESGLTAGEKCGVCGIITKEQTPVPATGHLWSGGICSGCGKVCDHDYDAEKGSCTVCGDNCDHAYDTAVTAPDCTKQGYTTYTCVNCGNIYNGDYVPALGHCWADATCTAAKTCTACGITEGKPNGHNHTAVVTAPTCVDGGYTTHTCHCGDTYKDAYTSATGHIPGAPAEENRVEAKCAAEGSYETAVYCTACDAQLSRDKHTIPAKGHSYQATVTAPNCTEAGYTTHVCAACQDSYTDSFTPATGHEYGAWETAKEATCTENGSRNRACVHAGCSHSETEAIPATGHNHTAVVTPPTCTEGGCTTHTCHCGNTYTDAYTEALKHDMGKWQTTDATCTEDGEKVRSCQREGCSHSETEAIPAVGHSYGYAVTAKPTTDAEGVLTGTCGNCGNKVTKALPKLSTADYTYEVLKAPTTEESGTGRYTWNTTAYGKFSFEITLERLPDPVLLGDVNDDGKVTVSDLMRLANYFAKDAEVNRVNADVTRDGKVTVVDLMRLANYFAGKAQLS